MDIEAIYSGIVDGTGQSGDLSTIRRKLQLMALQNSRSTEVVDRLGSLRVASLLGVEAGRAIIERLVHDPERLVRTWAFNQAVAARDGGLSILRDAATGHDEFLALAAIDLLTVRVDRSSMPVVRRLLESPSPAIRAACARLLGHIAGPALLVQLRRLSDDPDPGVRHEAAQAERRIQGDLPVAQPDSWWDGSAGDLPGPPPMTDAVDSSLPQPPPLAHRAPHREVPADTAPSTDPSKAADLATSTAPEIPETPALPVLRGGTSPVVPPTDVPGALPSPLPTEVRALAKLLGMADPADHAVIVHALRASEAGELASHIGAWPRGGDAALGRGLALAAGYIGHRAAFSKLRQMATDPHAQVRAAASTGIGAVGGPSALPLFQHLLHDADLDVRAAAATALAVLCVRTGRQDIGQDYLSRVSSDQPDHVADAVRRATDALAS